MMMNNCTRILIAGAMFLCLHAHAAAETFFFSKTGHRGKILSEHSFKFANDDRAFYSDVERVELPVCDHVQKMIVSTRRTGAAVTAPPNVALGTMVSVRRAGADDVFVVAVMESRAVPSGCMPSVFSTSSIFHMALKSGERVRIAQQVEPDGSQTTWWLRRE